MPGGIVLEDYLVRLGFNLNATGLNQFIELIGKGKRQITSMIPMLNNNLVKASFTTGSFLATVAVGTMKLMEAVAQADIEMEVFARKMWMNEEAARGMSAAAEVLGYSLDDLSSIALSPELTEQFRELYDITKSIRPPDSLQDYLQQIREVSFEWKKFGVIAKYSVHWVTYYLSKFLNKELETAKKYLQEFNEWFEKNVPKIAKLVASFIANILRMSISFLKFVKMLLGFLNNILNLIEKAIGLSEGTLLPLILAIGSAIFVATSPILSIIAVITMIILLIDDLMTYLEGGDSLLGGIWEKAEAFAKNILVLARPIVELIGGLLAIVSSLGINFESIWSGAVDFVSAAIDGVKLLYYHVRLIGSALKDAFTLNWDFPSVKEWTEKINDITVNYVPKSMQEDIVSSGFANSSQTSYQENNSSYKQNVYVYSNDPKAAGKQVAKQTEVILNRGLRR